MFARVDAHGTFHRSVRRIVFGVTVAVALLMTTQLSTTHASMNKTRFMERDGQLVIVSQDVGNQALPVQWVENDARRHQEDGLTLYYRIDLTELPRGFTSEETETAIESAVATFNDIACGQNLRLLRVDGDPDRDLGFIQNQVGLGGNENPVADITFGGWVPNDYFVATGLAPAFAGALPIVWDATDGSLVWGLDALDPTRAFADINSDGKVDVFAFEIYFNQDGNYAVYPDDTGGTLGTIDLETVVLHELGHALGMDHFGRTKVILDEEGNLVDLVVNQASANLMNTNAYYVNREVSGSDRASFCGIYADWGKTNPPEWNGRESRGR